MLLVRFGRTSRGPRQYGRHPRRSIEPSQQERLVFSDSAGNDERLTFLYDSRKVTLLEEVGELAFPPSELRHVKLPGIDQTFQAFDRNPYLVTFKTDEFVFTLVNCHSLFGNESKPSMDRRTLETYAIARWTDRRRRSRNAVTKDVVVLCDMNLPKVEKGDPIHDALTKRGLHIPLHSTKIGSSLRQAIRSDSFLPG